VIYASSHYDRGSENFLFDNFGLLEPTSTKYGARPKRMSSPEQVQEGIK
jgi:hypothetical protein